MPSKLLREIPHGVKRDAIALPRVSGPRRITQKVLLLAATGEEPSYLAAKGALDRIGVPYRSLLATQEEVTAALLTDDVSKCHFNSVIFSTSGLGYLNTSTGAWESALSAEEWARIADFELACSAREAIWYAWPSPDLGLAYASSFNWDEQVDAKISAPSYFPRVRSNARIPYRYAAGYRATIVDTNTTALVEDVNGGVLLALHKTTDGRDVMVSTADHSPYLTHSLVLEYDLIKWVTKGMFVGKKRSYIAPQIDDIFLDNDMWVPGEGNQGTTQFRITGADIDALVAWQTAFKATLPTGSTFMTDMAFNGVGTLTSEYADQTLVGAARRAGRSLTWLNHTWDHDNMDAMTFDSAKSEVKRNCEKANNLNLNGFVCADLVTPDMSGTVNAAALAGMYSAGARYIVTDTSITAAIRPLNPGTNPSFNVGRANPIDGRIYQIPRHPTSIYYDVATPANETDEYNHIYRSYYGRDLSYDEVLDKDSAFGLFYLLQGDIDPLMFHQANLARYTDGTGRVRSLYSDWVDVVVGKYLALSNAPVLTLGQAEIGKAMQERGKLDACGVTATIVESSLGYRSLELRTVGGCAVPVAGLASYSGKIEMYGGEPTTTFSMNAGGVKSVLLPSQ